MFQPPAAAARPPSLPPAPPATHPPGGFRGTSPPLLVFLLIPFLFLSSVVADCDRYGMCIDMLRRNARAAAVCAISLECTEPERIDCVTDVGFSNDYHCKSTVGGWMFASEGLLALD